MTLQLLHGIYCTNGKSALSGLIPIFRDAGYEVQYPDYGFISGVESKIANPIITGCIAPYVRNTDTFIGHSNGCVAIYELLYKRFRSNPGDRFGVVFLNPALENNVEFPPSVTWCDVYHNHGDVATEIAVAGQTLGLTDGLYGNMGHVGYKGADARVTNIDCAAQTGLPRVWGHSAIGDPDEVGPWGKFIIGRMR